MTRRILIRADDLGYSEGVNYGLAKSVKDGIIRSVGVMPNMPAAKHGLDLLIGVDVCYGQHTNICVGKPLTTPEQIPSLCQPNGEFKPSKAYRDAVKSGAGDFVVLDEVILEIEAQYQRYLELVGERPRYFEGHAVASDNFFKGLQIVAERHGLPYLAMAMPGQAARFRSTNLYPCMDSVLPEYDPFESLKREAMKDYGPDGCCMFICHPGYLDDYILKTSSMTIPRAQEVAMSVNPVTKAWLEENDVRVVTYDEL